MKMKKFACLLAAVLGACSLAACGNANNKTAFSDYWLKNSLAPGDVNEVLEYKVTFDKGSGLDGIGYILEYGVGTYKTTLLSTTDGYSYKTELTMPVTYTLGSESSGEQTDKVTTEVTFARADKALKPVSSKKTVESRTPKSAAGATVEDCYTHYIYAVDTNYTENGEGTSTVTYTQTKDISAGETTSTFACKAEKYSYLDNEQLLLALRAIPLSATDGTVESYNPFLKKTQQVKYSFATATSGDFSHVYTDEGTAVTVKTVPYREVTLVLNEKNPGATQTAWIATHSDAKNNLHRNVMLYLKTPLSYSLGSLEYKLSAMTVNA